MSRNVKIIIGLILVFIAGGIFTFFTIRSKNVELNSPLAVGNTAGNVYNGGMFCELNGKVYFVDTANGSVMYSMNVDESGAKQLTTSNVKNILAYGNYLYYYMDSSKGVTGNGLEHYANQYGIFRADLDGKNQVGLTREYTGTMQLCGNYIYYQVPNGNDATINKVKIDKSEDPTIVMQDHIVPACYENGSLYYAGFSKDLAIHAINTQADDEDTIVLEGYYYMPILQDGYMYYLKADANYCLCRANMTTGVEEILTTDRVDTYNLDGTHIYYATSVDQQALMMMNMDGTDQRILFNGICNSLNLTSQYLYFMIYGDEEHTYHIPLDGSEAVSPFIVN